MVVDDGTDRLASLVVATVRSPSLSTTINNLLDGFDGYIPDIPSRSGVEPTDGICDTLLGFRTSLDRLAVGPSPSVRLSTDRIASAICGVCTDHSKIADTAFVSPFPLTVNFCRWIESSLT